MNRIVLVLGLALLSLPAAAQQGEDGKGPSLRAKGLGHPPEQHRGKPIGTAMAERAAIADAVRNLAVAAGAYFEVVEGDEKTRVVEAFIAGFSVVSKTERPDGGVEVEVSLPIERVASNFRNALAEAFKARAEIENLQRENARLRGLLDECASRMEEAAKKIRDGR